MNINKIGGKGDNIEPERKGEKKLRDNVGNQFKEIEKTGSIDPDNRRRRREPSDSLFDLNTPKKGFGETPPVSVNDNSVASKAPLNSSSKTYDSNSSSSNYVPASKSSNDSEIDEETYGPEETSATSGKKPAETAAHKEKTLKAKLEAETKPLEARPIDRGKGPPSSAKTSKKNAPLSKEIPLAERKLEASAKPKEAQAKKASEKTELPKEAAKPKEIHDDKIQEKETVQKKETEESHEKSSPSPLAASESIAAHGASAQPTIIIGTPASPPPPISHAVASQFSHPEVARLFDQMVSHITAVASKGVKEVNITLSSGIFRGSQIIIRETSTALRNYNIELRGMTPQAQKLFEENAGALLQLFSNRKYPFTVHRIETRHLIERKERLGKDKEDQESDQ